MAGLSIIIPVYNEEQTLVALVSRVLSIGKNSGYPVQIILVDDGSTDTTRKILQTHAVFQEPSIEVLSHEENRGKGAAIRTAIPSIRYEYTVIQDADLEYDPVDAFMLHDRAVEHGHQVVFGSRNQNKENERGTPLFYWGGRLVTSLTNVLFKQKLTDEATCYKLIQSDLLKSLPLRCTRFEFCPELTGLVSNRGVEIIEYPISYDPRSKGEGKKISWRDGIEACWTLFRIWLSSGRTAALFFPLFFFFFALYLTTWHGAFGGYEAETAQSAVALLRGELDLRRAGVVAAVMYLPFVLLMELFHITPRLLAIVPVFYSALAMVCLYGALALCFSRKRALVCTFLTGLASIIWPYTNIGMEYQAMLLLTALFWALLAWQKRDVSLLWAGIILGLLVGAKSYGVVFSLPALLFVLQASNVSWRKAAWWKQELLPLAIPSVLMMIMQVGFNFSQHGALAGAYSLAHEFQVWTWWEGFYGLFFSAGKSLFLFSPLLILALFGVVSWWKKERSSAAFVLSSFFLLLLITAPFSYWTDETWGPRKLVPVMLLLHVPIGYVLEKRSRLLHIFIAILALVGGYVQILGGMYTYGKQLAVLRAGGVDTLMHMRFVPQLSHVRINHQLLSTFLTKAGVLSYHQDTWFRWTIQEPDVRLVDVHVPLAALSQPDVFWYRTGRMDFWLMLMIGAAASGGFLLWQATRVEIFNKKL